MSKDEMEKEWMSAEMAEDLVALRQSVVANDVLRAKLRKQLLTGIQEASADRPRPISIQKWPLLWKGLACIAGVMLIAGAVSLSWNHSDHAHIEKHQIEALQQRQVFSLSEGMDQSVSISQDHRYAAFIRNHALWLHDMTSGFSQSLVPLSDEDTDHSLAWMPGNARIAVTEAAKGQSHMSIVSLNERTVQSMTQPPEGMSDTQPAWSSDGKWLAFTRSKQISSTAQETPVESEIWVVSADGKHSHKIITQGSQPAWSPNGEEMAFTRQIREGDQTRWEVWKMNADGSHARKITDGRSPWWSPNSQWIAYENPTVHVRVLQTTTDGKPLFQVEEHRQEIWVMDRNGEHQTRLTEVSVKTPTDEEMWLKNLQEQQVTTPSSLLATGTESHWNPVWSADVNSLYFVRQLTDSKKSFLEQVYLKVQ